MQRETDFCVECREMSSYSLQKRCVTKNIRGENLTFEITCAVCDTCGGFMSVPGIIDLNVHEIDEQYRKLKGLVSIEDIHTLMELYNIGKAPLSIVLGFGEITITRYLLGQVLQKSIQISYAMRYRLRYIWNKNCWKIKIELLWQHSKNR